MKLTEFDKFKVLRPLPNDIDYDDSMPVIKKDDFKNIDWNEIKLRNFKSSKKNNDPSNTIVVTFNYDKVLDSFWNCPLNHILRFQKYLAITSPDFSIYPGMNKYEAQHNVFKNRWIGCLWQTLGIKVIPTISWGEERTFSFAFKGIKKGSIVAISTLGCTKQKEVFLKGYKKMIEIISPSIVIVVGKQIKGMTGNILQFDYTETFNMNTYYEQLYLFHFDRLTFYKEDSLNG